MGLKSLNNPERSAANYHTTEANRLLVKATAEADSGRYRRAQTLLELSEAHSEAAVRCGLDSELRGIR